MRQLLLLSLLFLIGSSAQGQSVIVSEDIPLRSDMRYEVLSMSNGKTLLFRDRVFEQDVIGFDETLHKKWTQELYFEKKRIGIIGMVSGTEDFTIFYQFRDGMSIFLIGRKYDEKAQVLRSDTILTIESMLNTPEYYFAHSKDHKKALIFSSERNKVLTAMGVDVDSIGLLWNHTVSLDEANVRKEFRQAMISNKGDGYIVFEGDNMWTRRETHRLEVIPLDSMRNRIFIPLEGIMCYDVKFEFNNGDNSIIGSCSFSEKSDFKTVGIKTFDIGFKGPDDYALSTIRFGDDLLQDIYGKKVNKKKGLRDLVIRHLQPRADGGLVIFGELSKEYSRRPSFATAASAYSRRWVDYYFEDIVAFSIHPDGKLHWSEVLHKRQYSQDDDAMYSSFFVFELPAQLRILFNDEIRSENTVSEYIVTGRGLQERKNLMSTDYQNLKLRFREAIQTSNQSLIVPSLKGNRLSLVKITYNEL